MHARGFIDTVKREEACNSTSQNRWTMGRRYLLRFLWYHMAGFL